MKGDLLGHIACPYCGTKGGMVIKEDKNGDPFGFCEVTCYGQLPVRGDKARKSYFFKNYPELKQPGSDGAGVSSSVDDDKGSASKKNDSISSAEKTESKAANPSGLDIFYLKSGS